ncbi:MAG: hypothetical protein EOP10_02570 [Proteobacteria bacterium]|nr:MAG: hypothetical protein EOP10_02570 [Pseudomonadota bacterium]
MYELQCPSCNKPSHYNFADFLLLCPFCSTTFRLDQESGLKEVYGDHYIIPNTIDGATGKELALEWLRRLHHKPGAVEQEFFVTDVKGMSIPLWIVSLEGHTAWKGLVKKSNRQVIRNSSSDYLMETGQFRRTYRWAINARNNICETWGLTRLHEPPEPIHVEWDGFPFDSTFTRGRIIDEDQKTAYESRNYFEFKYANGLPILGIQVHEDEGLRRAKNQIELYHYKLACLNADYLIDYRTELEVAGIQLTHVPVWKVTYVYRPSGMLKHLQKPREKHLLIDGYGKGILNGELALVYHDKIMVNAYVAAAASFLFLVLGAVGHPAFLLIALFAMGISALSVYTSMKRKAEKEEEELRKLSASHSMEKPKDKTSVRAQARAS